MQHRIVFADSGKPCLPGTALHAIDRVAAGPHVYRLESHQYADNGAHTVTVSRHHPKFGRVKRVFHPRVFGLTVEVEITWYQSAKVKIHKGWHETWFGIYLGILALVGLAIFEQYHLADEITAPFAAIMDMMGMGGESAPPPPPPPGTAVH
jgi:hypothetical protein